MQCTVYNFYTPEAHSEHYLQLSLKLFHTSFISLASNYFFLKRPHFMLVHAISRWTHSSSQPSRHFQCLPTAPTIPARQFVRSKLVIFESWNLGHLACDMCKQNSSFFFYYLWNLREYDEALCGRSIKPIRQEIIRRAFCNQRIHTDPPKSFRRSLGRSSQSLKSVMIQLLPRDFSCILQLSPELSGWKIWFGNEAQILSLGPCRSS